MKSIKYRGKLVWPSLVNQFPSGLIVGANRSASDAFGLGWSVVNGEGLRLTFTNILYATAEATVATAVLAETLRAAGTQLSVKVDKDDAWVRALRLDQLCDSDWQRPQVGWSRPADCYCYPLRRVLLTGPEAVPHLSERLARAVSLLPDDVLGNRRYDIFATVERIAREAFANIFEHAYLPGTPCLAYVCATVSPVGNPPDSKSKELQVNTPQETAWIAENASRGLVLEIAIGDCGLGVPATLWKSEQIERARLATRFSESQLEERNARHQQLCEYAFHHSSTRKADSDFPSPAAKLNWRGLHRSVHSTEHLGGSIILASGAGRAGYAFVDNQMARLSNPHGQGLEFPGTIIVLRISTNPTLTEVIGPPHSGTVNHFKLDPMFCSTEVEQPIEIERKFESSNPQVVALLMPFSEIRSSEELIEHVRTLPSGVVAALLFGEIPKATLAELRATTADWESCRDGFPRLIFVWGAEGYRWKLAGSLPIPPETDRILHQLESSGSADCSNASESLRQLVHELITTYPHFLRFDKKSSRIRFTLPQPSVDPIDFSSALQKTFAELITRSPNEAVFVAPEGYGYLLPTGRVVKKFISALHLLRRFPVLRAAMAQRMVQILEQYGRISDMSLIADDHASYFVASALVRNWGTKPQLLVSSVDFTPAEGRKCLIFVDVVFRAETLGRLVTELKSRSVDIAGVITSLDLRPRKWEHIRWPNQMKHTVEIRSLLPISFDPEVLSPSVPIKELEIDSITHIPTPPQSSDFVSLGTSRERETFLESRADLFRSGFHRIGGRVHTVSLRTARLVDTAPTEVTDWMISECEAFLANIDPNHIGGDIVVFCRPESNVCRLAEAIGRGLCQRRSAFTRVFVATLTVTAFGPKPLFPREASNLLAELREVLSNSKLGKPDEKFFAVYLDDAAITGSSLRDFVTKAAGLDTPAVGALLTLLAVNRLTPGENRFLDLYQEVRSTSTTPSIPVGLRTLFRLQVRWAERDIPSSVSDIITEISDHRQYYDDRLYRYVIHIRDKIDQVFKSPESLALVQHPFYPEHSNGDEELGIRAIRVRHLLALHQQNEPVIADILRQVSEAKEDGDTSLLSMLAIEPFLLREDPLASECSQVLTDLCILTLTGDATPQVKSDAIAVLAINPPEFINRLTEVLKAIGHNESLVNEAAIFLLVLCRKDRAWQKSIWHSIDEVDWAPSEKQWLRDIINVPDVVADKYLIDDGPNAINRIHSLVASTWMHLGLQQWQEFDNVAKGLVDEPNRVISAAEIQLAADCLRYAERVLMPGLGAIHYFAVHKPDIELANTVFEALMDSTRAHADMVRLLADARDGKELLRRELQDTWNALRRSTLKGASPVRFLGELEPVSEDPPIIERMLPMFFSSPHLILQAKIGRSIPTMRIDAPKDPFIDKTVVVQVPASALYHVFRILTGNVTLHGIPHQSWAALSIDAAGALRIEIINPVRKERRSGTKRGIPLVYSIADREQFTFEPAELNGMFTARLIFPHAMVVSPDLARH